MLSKLCKWWTRLGRHKAPAVQSKRRRPVRYRKLWLEALEERIAPATITWGNLAGGNWDSPANWVGGVLPGASDDVVINNFECRALTVTHAAE